MCDKQSTCKIKYQLEPYLENGYRQTLIRARHDMELRVGDVRIWGLDGDGTKNQLCTRRFKGNLHCVQPSCQVQLLLQAMGLGCVSITLTAVDLCKFPLLRPISQSFGLNGLLPVRIGHRASTPPATTSVNRIEDRRLGLSCSETGVT